MTPTAPSDPAAPDAGTRPTLTDLLSVDIHALSVLHEQIPAGPYRARRCGDGATTSHEVRAVDARPDDKHHWPYRLLASIPGQTAGCDDAVFDFVAGVVNAWPLIAELCEEGALARILAAKDHEVRDAIRADGTDPDEAVAEVDRIAREAFAAHGFARATAPTPSDAGRDQANLDDVAGRLSDAAEQADHDGHDDWMMNR